MDGAEEGGGFAVEEGGVADEGDGRVGGGVGAVAQCERDARRVGLIVSDLHDLRSGVGVWWLDGYRFERGKIWAVGTFRMMVHLDRHLLAGFINVNWDSMRDILWFDGSGVVQKTIQEVGIVVPGFPIVILSQNNANLRSRL